MISIKSEELPSIVGDFRPTHKHFQVVVNEFVGELIKALNSGSPIYFIFDKDGLMVDSEVIGKLAWIEALKEFGVDLGLGDIATENMLNASKEQGWTKGLKSLGVPDDVIRLAEFVGKRADAVDAQIFDDFGERIKNTEKYKAYDAKTDGARDVLAMAEIRALKEHHLNGYLDTGIPVKPGLLRLLRFIDYLKNNPEIRSEILSAVATSDSRGPSESQLESIGAYTLFNDGVFKGDYSRSKPAPDAFIEAENRLKAKGDSKDSPLCISFEDSPAGVEGASAANHWTIAVPDMIEFDSFRLPVTALSKIIPLRSLDDFTNLLWRVISAGEADLPRLDSFSDEVIGGVAGPVMGSNAT